MKERRRADDKPIEISESDIVEAMQDIEGYIDISPGDFREIFLLAYRHAVDRLTRHRTAGQIMSRPVHCLNHRIDLQQAALFLAENGISGAPVVDAQGLLIGVLSEKDFLLRMGVGPEPTFMKIISHCLHNESCLVSVLRNHRVEEIMTRPPISAGPEINVVEMASLFAEHRINRLPIVDSDEQPIGIVTRADLVHCHCLFGIGERA
jgi:CBS domain-containing membrane protein